MKKLLSVTVNIAPLQTTNSTSVLPLPPLCTEATGSFLWAGSRQWAGSLLPLCVTSLSQTFALGSLSIYGEVLHFPPLTDGAIPCRHRSCSPCVWENVCVTDRVIERGAGAVGSKEGIPYKAETWTSAWLVHRSCCGVSTHLSLLTDLELSVFAKGGGSFPPVKVLTHCKNTAVHCPTCCSSESHWNITIHNHTRSDMILASITIKSIRVLHFCIVSISHYTYRMLKINFAHALHSNSFHLDQHADARYTTVTVPTI